MIYLNLFYYFMVLFECNDVVILSLIIFFNCNQRVNSYGLIQDILKSHSIARDYQLVT
jgi:hypothetical protein